MDGRVVAITGASSGIGAVTARDLFKRGAKVLMLCRDLNKASAVKTRIESEFLNDDLRGRLEVVALDLASLESVRRCAAEVKRIAAKIDVLINNAGVAMSKQRVTNNKTRSGLPRDLPQLKTYCRITSRSIKGHFESLAMQ